MLQESPRGHVPENNSDEVDNEDIIAKEQASRLKSLADKVEEFIEGEGDLEGARFAE